MSGEISWSAAIYRVSREAAAVAIGEHTSGLVQIVKADERASIAVVVYACDELMKGDFLASFTPEPIRTPDPFGIPVYGDAARILFADAGQMLGMARRLMVIDRGSEHGIRVGQRLTLFRRPGRDAATFPVVGDAVVVAVRIDSATIRVERSTDVIWFGDWAAPQRQSPAARRSRQVRASLDCRVILGRSGREWQLRLRMSNTSRLGVICRARAEP